MIRFLVFGLCAVGIAFGLWFYGFIRFVEIIPRHTQEGETNPQAIVILTGGNGRLQAGFDLLARKGADGLLISGVDPGVDPESLLSVSGIDARLWRDQISVGYQARDTIGNAEETAAWIKGRGLRSVHLVTENYHLPRSLRIFRRVMPDLEIIPYAVVSDNIHLDSWWQWPGTTQLLIGEYNKYLIVCLSEMWGIR